MTWSFIICNKIWRQLLHRGPAASKKEAHKAGEVIGYKIVDAVLSKTLATPTKSNYYSKKQEPLELVIIPPEKRDEILNKLRKIL